MLKKDTYIMLLELIPLDVHISIMGKISIVASYATAVAYHKGVKKENIRGVLEEAIDLSIKVIKNQTQSRSSDKTKIDLD